MRTRTGKLDNGTASDSVTPVLDRLTHEERSQVLSGLLDIRAGIVEEAEQLAEEILGVAETDRVADEVKNDLRNLDLGALGARAGWGSMVRPAGRTHYFRRSPLCNRSWAWH